MWPTKVRTASPPFQSTLPARGATVGVVQNVANAALFQSTLPARGATGVSLDTLVGRDISIHAPCTGSDFPSVGFSCACSYFNPRSLHGERQSTHRNRASAAGFQSTLPARGATWTRRRLPSKGEISIHAPCTGSDLYLWRILRQVCHFNPRSLHGERRRCWRCSAQALAFQSTLPARGATYSTAPFDVAIPNFNPRSLHGERRLPAPFAALGRAFQSTLPARGATRWALRTSTRRKHFNPRSLHGERRRWLRRESRERYFNPRSLHGERQICTLRWIKFQKFQSTLPARGATIAAANSSLQTRDFNPRSLHGERRYALSFPPFGTVISIHAPCTGSDRRDYYTGNAGKHFNPRSLHGERPMQQLRQGDAERFQSTLPARGATKNAAQTGKELMISIHAPCTGSDCNG